MILLDGDVNGDAGLEIDDVLLEVADLPQELQAGLIGLEALELNLLDVLRSLLQVDLKHVLLAQELFVLAFEGFVFLHK